MRLFIFISLIFLLSCDVDKLNKKLTKSDFPIEAGDQWTYLRTSLTTGDLDTLSIYVKSNRSSVSDIDSFFCHIHHNDLFLDSAYYVQSEDFLSHYWLSVENEYFNFHLEYPLEEGDKWTLPRIVGISSMDTATVTDFTRKKTSILDEEFKHTFTIHRDVEIFQVFIRQDVVIAPGVGLVKQTVDYAGTMMNGSFATYELIDHH